jgi:hypothetical protein
MWADEDNNPYGSFAERRDASADDASASADDDLPTHAHAHAHAHVSPATRT